MKNEEADRIMEYEERIRRLEKILANTSIFKNNPKLSRSLSPEHKANKADHKET